MFKGLLNWIHQGGLLHWLLRAYCTFIPFYIFLVFLLMPFLALLKIGEWRWVPLSIAIKGFGFGCAIAFIWAVGNWVLNKFITMPTIKTKADESDDAN